MLVGGSAGLFVFARYLWDSAPSIWKNRKAEINRTQEA